MQDAFAAAVDASLQESRRAARTSADGDVILLEDQERSLWNREYISQGLALVEQALRMARSRSVPAGPYTLQAAIAAVHAEAPSSAETDWNEIVALYDLLLHQEPSPVIELNRAPSQLQCAMVHKRGWISSRQFLHGVSYKSII